jgi:surface antigen
VRENRIATVLFAAALLAGCAETAGYVNENPHKVFAPVVGGAVGAAAGEAIGSTTAQAGLGAAGVIVGLAAGPYLQKRDVVFFDKAIDQAAVAVPGKSVHWSNPNTGTRGTMTRVKDVSGTGNESCRLLRSEVSAGGGMAVEDLIVCRPERGTWYIDWSWPVERRPAG